MNPVKPIRTKHLPKTILWTLLLPMAASAQLQMSLSIANPPAPALEMSTVSPTNAKATAKTVAAVNAITVLPEPRDCKNPKLSNLSRFWELEKDSDCDGLRFHTQLFSGYGDSMVDYNRRRILLSVGLNLVDW